MKVDLPGEKSYSISFKHFEYYQPKKGDVWHRAAPPSKYPRSTMCAINRIFPFGVRAQRSFSYTYWNPAVEPQYKGHEIARRRSLAKALAKGGFTRDERRAIWLAYWASKSIKPKPKKSNKPGFKLPAEALTEGVGA